MKTLLYVLIASVYIAPTCSRKTRITIGAGFFLLAVTAELTEVLK